MVTGVFSSDFWSDRVSRSRHWKTDSES